MALYTDSDFVTQASLAYLDTEIAKIAAAETVIIDGPTGLGAQACSECAIELTAAVQTFGGYPSIGGVSWAHNAAVLNVGSYGVDMPRLMLSQIVLDGLYPGYPSPLKRWVEYRALFMFYRDVSSRKGKANDRYEEKRETYKAQALTAFKQLKQTGLPFVTSPLACPGATHEQGSGSWGSANVTKVSGSGAAGTFYVAVTYVDGTYYQDQTAKGNAESGPSALVSVTPLISELIRVDITSLNPPNGTASAIGVSDGILTRKTATGWNVYVGASVTTMYLQNSTVLPIATKTYTLGASPAVSGYLLGTGQYPDAKQTFQNIIQRA